MTDDQINRLLELQKRFDAGVISKDMFDLGVAAIRGADKNSVNESKPKPTSSTHKKRNIIIAIAAAVVLLLSFGIFLLLHNKDKGEVQMGPMNVIFPDDYTIMNVVERYCTAICENDFTTLASLYAQTVERYQDAYDKNRDYVIGCHQRYDNTFKVHGKHSSIRRETFKMEPISNNRVSVVVVEDYSIDREDKSKYSVFVLEKHFVIDSAYHIVSVYDNQLAKSKGVQSIGQLASSAFSYVMKEYARGAEPLDVGTVYNKVDFRKSDDFCNLVRQIVSSDSDFQTMMNSNVRTTEFMDFAMGKIGSFDIVGDDYSISLNQYMGGDMKISIKVNGHWYDWESPDYMSTPLYPGEVEDDEIEAE